MKRLFAYILLLTLPLQAWAAPPVKLSGKVVEAGSGEPIPGAIVRLDGDYLWSVTDLDGVFQLSGAERGTYTLEVSCLGYVTVTQDLSLKKDITDMILRLAENTLALQEVVVTAETAKDNLNTTRKIGRQALDHLQMNSMEGIGALLPGGKTINPDLTSESALSLRAGGSGAGNAAFSTAVEVNGVRMGDNASFGGMEGVSTRSISVENIESVEVLTGVPSAEYGDFGSGMIRVTTKKGRTPLNIVLGVNPRTYEVSVSKGLEVGKGTLNLGAEWARATSNLVSPYTAYTRRGFTVDYTHTFAKVLRLEAGLNGNIGGMNSKNDPDAINEFLNVVNDNLLTPHFKLTWLLNRSWITNLTLEGSVYYHDTRSLKHERISNATSQPAVHALQKGYWMADALPANYVYDLVTDSKELDYAASLKYHWLHHWGDVKNVLKAGIQWKADGNVGKGAYYLDPAVAAHAYRPRPYTDYPYMHTLAGYLEDNVTIPIGRTSLNIMAGLRMENVFISGSQYNNLRILSPRFNAKWALSDAVSLRGGWGVAGKLPSFFILYPEQKYFDIRTTGFTHGSSSSYVYYTQPYQMTYNPGLRWQRNQNAEVGLDVDWKGFRLSLAGFYNLTKDPYEFGKVYTPISYNVYEVPSGYTMPENPEVVLDHQTGAMYLKDVDGVFVASQLKVANRTFSESSRQENGADIHRWGVELVADFPEIKPIRTTLRLDAAWNHTQYTSTVSAYYYRSGWTHSTLPGRSYEYVGVYTGNGSNSVANGRVTDNLDANLTAITHIPQARLIISVRLEAALLRMARNTSDRAFTVGESGFTPTGGNIYDGNSYAAVYPEAYIDLDGQLHPWTAASAADPALQQLILRTNNMYTFAQDGYNPYLSANISVTKEIGNHVSVSFFANNFTNARPYVKSWAFGHSQIFTPSFYYGLRCTIKI